MVFLLRMSDSSREISSIHEESKGDKTSEKNKSLSGISNKHIRELVEQEGLFDKLVRLKL